MTTISIKISPEYLRVGEKELSIEIDKDGMITNRTGSHRKSDQSVFLYMTEVIKKLQESGQVGTANNYTSALKSFQRFRKGLDLKLENFNTTLMNRYELYLKSRKLKQNTISFYMRILRAVYNRAVDENLVNNTNPFKHVFTGLEKTDKRAMPTFTLKEIRKLIPDSRSMMFARDMFLFSFYTRGMSFVDMAYLKKSDLCDGVLTYRRLKSGQLLSMKWEKCMQEIVDRYPSYNDTYLLPIIKDLSKNERRQYKSKQFEVNRQLKRISSMLSLGRNLTMYVARHSWASIAKRIDVPIGVISEGMGHTSLKTTQIYLTAMDKAVIDKANARILKSIQEKGESH